MRLPNGYGSVTKMSGARRKPFRVRKTVGWTDEGVQVFKTIGFYATRQQALQALAEYNMDPYDLQVQKMTLQDLFDKWSEGHYKKVGESSVRAFNAAWHICAPIAEKRVKELKLSHFQGVFDASGKNTPTLQRCKIMLGLMYDFAVQNEVLPSDKRDMIRYINTGKEDPKLKRKPFTDKEIKALKAMDDLGASAILILIYSGLRIGELLDLKKEDVHLQERWIDIKHSKTRAGVRIVPVAEKIVPYIEAWMACESEYLVPMEDGKPYTYGKFRMDHWDRLAQGHTPHDTRHTCISKLTAAGVDERIIKKIVGHAGKGVTQQIYTHVDLATKLEAINRM